MTNQPTSQSLRALLFPVDGRVAPLAIDPAEVLHGLYRAIHCTMVEIVVLDDGIDLWCDEEAGLQRRPKVNRAWLLRRCNAAHPQPLFGHVVALGRTKEGIARSLTVEEADLAMSRVVGVSRTLATLGDSRPDHAALTRWLVAGIDWRN